MIIMTMMIIELGKFTLLTTVARVHFTRACEHSNKLPQFCDCVRVCQPIFERFSFFVKLFHVLFLLLLLPLPVLFVIPSGSFGIHFSLFFLFSLPQKTAETNYAFSEHSWTNLKHIFTENQTKWVIFSCFNNCKVERDSIHSASNNKQPNILI